MSASFPPPPGAPGGRPPVPPPSRCQWCGGGVDASMLTCPACGSGVDVRTVTTDSGWQELAPIPDMARIQFGHSRVQIEGSYVPVADFALHEGDAVYFSHHTLLWKDEAVPLTRSPNGSAWKRMIGGLPLIMAQATGPGRVALSMDRPGETIAVPLTMGQGIDVREHHFLAATDQVGYDYLQSGVWFRTKSGDETETHYPLGMYLDRFYAGERHGLVLLHAGGNVFERMLREGETICIKPPSLLFKDPAVGMALHYETPNGSTSWGGYRNDRYVWLRMWGPGRVCIQSQYEHFEDSFGRITGSSMHTQVSW